jgi:predicted nuclease with RNAse H fold
MKSCRRPEARRWWGVALLMSAALTVVETKPQAATHPAAEPPRAVFALIIGVNASSEPDVAPLQYADDDAARYLDLFRALGARAYVLSRLDGNTRRLHPQAAAEAVAPRRAELRQAVESLARDITQARARGVRSTLYVVYAGHGDVQDAGWYLTLEDGRLSGAQLMSDVVDRAGADQSHVIIDACHAYLLAMPRGPGGTRRPLGGFVELEAASRAGRIGYLLSSSVSGESHEWAGFEAGVFSHEVRSGLYGAADADGDGRVTYAEIGAFVARANEAITSERFRPRVLARAPRDGDLLLDLRSRAARGLRLDGPTGGSHFLLEDMQGVRLLDFHGTGTTPVQLMRPPGEGPLYLRRVADGTERTIPRTDGVVQVADLPVTVARTQTRGAAHHAFSQLFTLAFDGGVVRGWTQQTANVQARFDAAETARERAIRNARLRRIGGFTAIGVAVAAGTTAVLLERSAHDLHNDAPGGESQRDTFTRNQRIDSRNRAATALAVGAVAAGVTSAVLLLWPRRATAMPEMELASSPKGAEIGARWHF